MLKKISKSLEPHFIKGGKWERYYPIYEVLDTFILTPSSRTTGTIHVRDHLDSKRLMTIVVIALIPCILMALYNTGLQANTALLRMGFTEANGWRGALLTMLNIPIDQTSWWANMMHGFLYFMPIYLVTNIVGGFWEVLFSVVRKHEVNEGMLVTGVLFPLILPASMPLWQVAIGISFGIVIGKEIFGGTGKNFLNPALVGRAFLFFAYPAQISGDLVWIAVDGFSAATPLSFAASGGVAAIGYSFRDAFMGTIAGSMGETSTIACLIGAFILIASGIGSWRIMISTIVGMVAMAFLFNVIGSGTNPMFALTPAWHFVLGGFAFGTIFMATDPISASQTLKGQYFYGLLIGILVVLIRVVNPAFPEGMMLAILFANMFAPLIDYYVVNAHIKKRKKRIGALARS